MNDKMLLWDRNIALGSSNLRLVKMKEEYADRLNRWLKKALKDDLYITFVKKNGETRLMHCTLRSSVLPQKELHQTRVYDPCLITVWDLDKNAWRTIPIDRIQTIRVGALGGNIWEIVKAF